MAQIFIGDVGTEIILECGVDVSSATVKYVIARGPRGPKLTWVAVLDTPTAIKYAIQVGDITQPGEWSFQSYVEMPGWKGFGEIAMLTVKAPLT